MPVIGYTIVNNPAKRVFTAKPGGVDTYLSTHLRGHRLL